MYNKIEHMTQFYTHIIDISVIHGTLHELAITEHERKELVLIAESGIHQVIVDTVLTELSAEDKKKFLAHLAEDDHEKIWAHLKEKTVGIEDKIAHAAHAFLKTLHRDLENLTH